MSSRRGVDEAAANEVWSSRWFSWIGLVMFGG